MASNLGFDRKQIKLQPNNLLDCLGSNDCLLECLSFLNVKSCALFGLCSKVCQNLSLHASNYTTIDLAGNSCDTSNVFRKLMLRTHSVQPLRKLTLRGVSKQCLCSTSSLRSVSAEGKKEESSNESNGESLATLVDLQHKFCRVNELKVFGVRWLDSGSLKYLIGNCRDLVTLDICQQVDVNSVVTAAASSCPNLKHISFVSNCTQLSEELGTASAFPLMRTDVAELLARGCLGLTTVRFRGYCVTEESINKLVLGLPAVEEADFSCHENVQGMFLSELHLRWPLLKKLSLRDCTEIDEGCVATFVGNIIGGGCPYLNFVDFSCQWSFTGDSLLETEMKERLVLTRPLLLWREDQCNIGGYGVDPDFGVESVTRKS